jgi:ABC-type dipeptide/oligopeptide/nickel transport system permease component
VREARTLAFVTRLFVDAVIPLAVAYAVIAFITDPAHIDVGELRANTLLMHARPLYRDAPGDEQRGAIGASAVLLLVSMAAATSLGVTAGIAYAWSRNAAVKAVTWSVATIVASLPAFFWAIAVELVMIFLWLRFEFRVLPIAGFGFDEHLVLPGLALGLRPAAYIFRFTAIAVEDIRHADYVRTAVAKGLGERRLLIRHVLPNAAPNIIAATVLAIRGALSSLLIIEYVYIWGGVGLTFMQALGSRRLELAAELALSFAVGSMILTIAAAAAQSRVPVAE